MHNLKLYHWDNVKALANRWGGKAYALAHNKAEAIQVILTHFMSAESQEFSKGINPIFKGELETELHETEPSVHTSVCGFYSIGM